MTSPSTSKESNSSSMFPEIYRALNRSRRYLPLNLEVTKSSSNSPKCNNSDSTTTSTEGSCLRKSGILKKSTGKRKSNGDSVKTKRVHFSDNLIEELSEPVASFSKPLQPRSNDNYGMLNLNERHIDPETAEVASPVESVQSEVESTSRLNKNTSPSSVVRCGQWKLPSDFAFLTNRNTLMKPTKRMCLSRNRSLKVTVPNLDGLKITPVNRAIKHREPRTRMFATGELKSICQGELSLNEDLKDSYSPTSPMISSNSAVLSAQNVNAIERHSIGNTDSGPFQSYPSGPNDIQIEYSTVGMRGSKLSNSSGEIGNLTPRVKKPYDESVEPQNTVSSENCEGTAFLSNDRHLSKPPTPYDAQSCYRGEPDPIDDKITSVNFCSQADRRIHPRCKITPCFSVSLSPEKQDKMDDDIIPASPIKRSDIKEMRRIPFGSKSHPEYSDISTPRKDNIPSFPGNQDKMEEDIISSKMRSSRESGRISFETRLFGSKRLSGCSDIPTPSETRPCTSISSPPEKQDEMESRISPASSFGSCDTPEKEVIEQFSSPDISSCVKETRQRNIFEKHFYGLPRYSDCKTLLSPVARELPQIIETSPDNKNHNELHEIGHCSAFSENVGIDPVSSDDSSSSRPFLIENDSPPVNTNMYLGLSTTMENRIITGDSSPENQDDEPIEMSHSAIFAEEADIEIDQCSSGDSPSPHENDDYPPVKIGQSTPVKVDLSVGHDLYSEPDIPTVSVPENEEVEESPVKKVHSHKKRKVNSHREKGENIASRLKRENNLFEFELEKGMMSTGEEFITCELVVIQSWCTKDNCRLVCRPHSFTPPTGPSWDKSNQYIIVISTGSGKPFPNNSIIVLHYPLTITYHSRNHVPCVFSSNRIRCVGHSTEELPHLSNVFTTADQNLLLFPPLLSDTNLFRLFPSAGISTLGDAMLSQLLHSDFSLELKILHVWKSANDASFRAVTSDSKNHVAIITLGSIDNQVLNMIMTEYPSSLSISGHLVRTTVVEDDTLEKIITYCYCQTSLHVYEMIPFKPTWIYRPQMDEPVTKHVTPFHHIINEKKDKKRYMIEVIGVKYTNGVHLIDTNKDYLRFVSHTCGNDLLKNVPLPLIMDAVFYKRKTIFADQYTNIWSKVTNKLLM